MKNLFSKETRVIVRGSGMNISANSYPTVCLQDNQTTEFIGSQFEADIQGSFQDNELGYLLFHFQFNNPMIGYPWAAVGSSSNAAENDQTSMSEGDIKVFHLKYYAGGDDGGYNDYYVKVTKLPDTDYKNFMMDLDYWPPHKKN